MKKNSANVAAFKAHLGEYLRVVKNGGEVIVMDRQTPVARLILRSHLKVSKSFTANRSKD
jgi:prevent-host-death family protein